MIKLYQADVNEVSRFQKSDRFWKHGFHLSAEKLQITKRYFTGCFWLFSALLLCRTRTGRWRIPLIFHLRKREKQSLHM